MHVERRAATRSPRRKQDDSAELRRKNAALRLLERVAVAANESRAVEDALQVALDEVCAYTGWPVGHVYLAPESDGEALTDPALWYFEDAGRFKAFREATESTPIRPGEGLAGGVLESGRAAWIVDLARDEDFLRATGAADGEVRSGFAFPILVGSEVAGLLEFFSTQLEPPDRGLLELMEQVGTQLGRAVERNRIELMKDRFISHAAHELRTPVAAIVGFSSLLAEQYERLDEQALQIARDALKRQSERLRTLVNNLLDFARFEHADGAADLQPTPVRTALEAIIAADPPPEGKSVQVGASDEAWVLADRLMFERMISNLLTNAYQYGGDSVLVEFTREDERIEISVSDDGAGVSPEVASQIFEPFARGPNTQETRGSGLGLAIVAALAKLQGGSVRYATANEHGARFTVRLKAAK